VTVRAVVFDVGETLVDETRIWSAWADVLGVPRLTFLGVLGGVIARGGDHREPFRLFRPDLDLQAEVRRHAESGSVAGDAVRDDLYADAEPAMARLAQAGYRLGIVGNQPARAEALFRELDVPLEFVASSATWGVEKPDARFFERIIAELRLPAREIAYVGDRLDNDVGPAARAGMVAVFIRRGPWGWIQAGRADPPEAALTIESLAELPAALRRLGEPPSGSGPPPSGG
jgi:HAD superfamily hydrolase (TIGR01662 family)